MGLFDKLESKLEQGVNGAFARAFKAEVQPVEIASGIRRAMDDRAASTKKGKRPIVPNLFTIELSPTDYTRLASWGDELDDELVASAQEHCDEQRYLPGGPLTIVLAEGHDLETGVFRLRPATAKASEALAHSRNFPRPTPAELSDEPDDIYLDAEDSDFEAHGAHALDASSDASGSSFNSTNSSSARGLGSRIKDYLRGEAPVTANDTYQDDSDINVTYDDRYDRDYDESYDTYQDHDDVEGFSGADDPSAVNGSYGTRPEAHEPRRPAPVNVADDGFDDYAGTSTHDAARNPRQSVAPRPQTGTARAQLPQRTPRPAPRPVPDRDDSDAGAATARFVPPAAPARPRTLSPRERPWLKIDGQRYPLLGAITTLGRDDDADIVIDDPGVSRRHSEIRITHDGPHLVMSIRDLDSTNGTFVNGDRTASQHLREGDRITVGRTHMTIHLGDHA